MKPSISRDFLTFRYQRGDQGPDDLDNDISIIDFDQNKTISVRPPIGGPNVCRSRSRTFCCPGWHQRGSTGLCLVPICSSNRCGSSGRCIKPGLCLCDGGTIATNCGNSNSIGSNGKAYLSSNKNIYKRGHLQTMWTAIGWGGHFQK